MEDLKASSREEALLAKIAGLDDPYADSIQPSSREEWFLNKIAEKTNGGGGGYDPYVVEIDVQTMTTDADFTTAKTKFFANEPVLFRVPTPNGGLSMAFAAAFAHSEDTDIIAAFFGSGESVLHFKSDGTIVVN